jgi:hypothetical protein
MATVLLTDEEYNFIKANMDELTNRLASASPRAATHFRTIAKVHAKFLSKEDGKRAQSQTITGIRETLQKADETRRSGNAAAARPTQSTQRPGPTTKSA